MQLCQFFGCGRKQFSKWENLLISCVQFLQKSYWVTWLWSASRCVYFVRPNTLLLCIFLFCIFLLYRTDPQVEVEIRILLKDKYVKSCQNANTGNHTWFPVHSFLENFLLGFFILQKQTASQDIFSQNPNFLLLCISFLHCMGLQPYNQDCFPKILRLFCASRN